MSENCENCDADLVLTHDEADQASCAACGYKYVECDRCGETVTEAEWKDAVSMCENCWAQTTAGELHPNHG